MACNRQKVRTDQIRKEMGSMNLNEVKDVLYDVASGFFAGASVIWAEQNNTTPPLPYVTLKMGGVGRNRAPVEDKDDFNHRYYPSSATLEINLYTAGKPVAAGDGTEDPGTMGSTDNHVNTAVSDLTEFFNYLESEYTTDYLTGKGIDICLNPPVRDLTSLQNNRSYRYRAMAEAAVSFPWEANNAYGTGYMADIPDSSGGGNRKMAGTPIEPIRKVVTKYKEEGGR